MDTAMYPTPPGDGLLYGTPSPALTMIARGGIDIGLLALPFDAEASPEDHFALVEL